MATPKTLSIFTLEGKNCIITGGAGRLGKQCLAAFIDSGANCAIVDLNLEGAQKTIADVSAQIVQETDEETSSKLQAYACNTVVEKDVEDVVAKVAQDFGQIDVLVTCAGICIHRATESTDLASWSKVMAVNLDGTFLFAREVGKHMLARQIPGSIILVASGAATHPPRPQLQASYNASKAGVKQLAVTLATEWASRGIRVNTLSPGYMMTPMMPDGDIQQKWLSQIPMGRFAKVDELQGTLVWLASYASSYVTGTDVAVDGGWSKW